MNRIKSLRNENKISQEELAKILNVSQQTISAYENNRKTPPIHIIEKLANYFNVSVDYLLCRTDKKNDDNIPVEKLYPDVDDVEEAMKIIMEQPGLMLNGEVLDDEDKMILANSIQIGLRLAEERRRKREKKN